MAHPKTPRQDRNTRRSPDRRQIVKRLMLAAEKQIQEIETRLAGTRQGPGAAERDARTLAVLARTMQSLTALDATRGTVPPRRRKTAIDDDDDRIPDSIDALRRELSQRLEGMAAGDARRVSGEASDRSD